MMIDCVHGYFDVFLVAFSQFYLKFSNILLCYCIHIFLPIIESTKSSLYISPVSLYFLSGSSAVSNIWDWYLKLLLPCRLSLHLWSLPFIEIESIKRPHHWLLYVMVLIPWRNQKLPKNLYKFVDNIGKYSDTRNDITIVISFNHKFPWCSTNTFNFEMPVTSDNTKIYKYMNNFEFGIWQFTMIVQNSTVY